MNKTKTVHASSEQQKGLLKQDDIYEARRDTTKTTTGRWEKAEVPLPMIRKMVFTRHPTQKLVFFFSFNFILLLYKLEIDFFFLFFRVKL